MATEKRCSKCREVKAVSEFYGQASHKDGLQSSCKMCRLTYLRELKARYAIAGPDLTVTEKRCSNCGEVKALSGFSKNHNAKDGLSWRCKECDAKYREEHHEEVLASAKKWARENPDKVAASIRKWREEHPNERAEYRKQYNEENHDSLAVSAKAWQQANPEKVAAISHRRRARLAGVISEPYEEEDVFDFWDYECSYCGQPCWTEATQGDYDGELLWSTHLTIEHITPIDSGGPDAQANVVAACVSCNSGKRNKPLGEWIWQRFPRQKLDDD